MTLSLKSALWNSAPWSSLGTEVKFPDSLANYFIFSSVQFSHSIMSDSLRPHDLQHARPPCPSPTPGVYSNSCPLSQWCHPAISSSVVPFPSCPQSFPASGSFPMSQLFAWGGQSIGVSASASVLPVNAQDWSPLGWTGWISLQSKGLSRVFSNTTVQKHQFFGAQLSSQSNCHIDTWPLEKPLPWLYLRCSYMESWERIGLLVLSALDVSFISAAVWGAVSCKFSFYLKGLPVSFSSDASEFSPEPEDSFNLYTGTTQNFKRVNILA